MNTFRDFYSVDFNIRCSYFKLITTLSFFKCIEFASFKICSDYIFAIYNFIFSFFI